MKVDAKYKKIIYDEFKFVANAMRSAPLPSQKIYFFSASYGMVLRVINIDFDDDLLLLHNNLFNAYEIINATINRIATGQEKNIQIPEKVWESLAQCLEKLADEIVADKDIYSVLKRISLLAYITTGNGYYMFYKGKIKV